MTSYTMWSMYSTVNSVSKGKYSFNLNQYCRVTALLNSYDTDIKKKANIFSTDDINRFVNWDKIATPYWMVRQVLVCLAYYGGLRHSELMGLRVEMCESSPEDVFLTHMRSKQRSDKRNSKFLVPRTQQKFTTKLYNGFLMLKGFQVRLDNCLKNKHQQNKLYFLNVKKLYVPIYR